MRGNTKMFVAIALMLTLFLVLSTPVFAMEMQGVLTSVQSDAFTFSITAKDGTDHVFRLAVAGRVLINDAASRLEDLQAGDAVQVTFDFEDKEMVATLVSCRRN
jgi:hypothetical protein